MLLMSLSALALAQESDPLTVLPTDSPPIINGEDADPNDWPMTGAMLLGARYTQGNQGLDLRILVCSSTLIAPDVVMLAAHCLDEDALTGGVGSLEDQDIRWTRQSDLSEYDGSSRQLPDWPDDAVAAWDWEMHSGFDLYQLKTGIAENDDIALIFLDEPVLDVPHAYLVTPDEADQVVEGVDVVVVGWGMQEATSSPLQSPDEGTYGYKQMGESNVGDAGETEFQVGVLEDDVRKCHGDSGGPSYFQVKDNGSYTETWRVVGVTSHAYDRTDCDSTGGVDTRVSAYYDWIDDELRERCEDGTRSWCDVDGVVPPPEPEPEPEDTGGEAGEGEGPLGGCGCATANAPTPAPTSAGWLLGLLGLVGLRRRP